MRLNVRGLLIGVVVAMLAILILQNRATVRGWLIGEARPGVWTALRQRIAEVWHFLAIAYVFAIYVVWILDITGGFRFLFRATILTIVIIALARLVTTALRRLVARGFALSLELKLRFPGLETRVNRYLPFFEAVLHGAIYLFFALALLEIWGLHAFAWLTSDFGRRVFGSVVTIVIIPFVAIALSEIVNELIERLWVETVWRGEHARRPDALPERARDLRRVITTRVGRHSYRFVPKF